MEKDEQIETQENRNVNINQNSPEILTNNIYTPAFLRENIGKLMRVEFLIGTDTLVDRTGILIDVGASYILLRALESDVITYADIYSIKFITISNVLNLLLGESVPFSTVSHLLIVAELTNTTNCPKYSIKNAGV